MPFVVLLCFVSDVVEKGEELWSSLEKKKVGDSWLSEWLMSIEEFNAKSKNLQKFELKFNKFGTFSLTFH